MNSSRIVHVDMLRAILLEIKLFYLTYDSRLNRFVSPRPS